MSRHFRAEKVRDVKKVAVLRANAVGDLVVALPALTALRHTYPDAEITLIGRTWHREFLRSRPGPVDRVEVLPPFEGLSAGAPDIRRQERFFRKMQEKRFDIALQMHGGGRYSNLVVNQLRARLTAGLRAENAPLLDRWIHYELYGHEIFRYLDVVALVGARPVTVVPELLLTLEDLAEAESSLQQVFHKPNLVVLNPGANDTRRWWPIQSYADLGKRLQRELGAQIVINSSADERDLCLDLEERLEGTALNMAGSLSLRGLLGLISKARLVVSNDTGPLHLALALKTPSVGLYWCGNFISYSPSFTRYHRSHLSWQTVCPVCAQSMHAQCPHRESFLTSITVEDVWRSVQHLWEDCKCLELAAS